MDKARNRGLGCPSEESFHNQDALKDLVGMYNLGTAIESAWSSKLGQREKLNLEREIGDETRRLEYALHVAAQCLEMSIVIGSLPSCRLMLKPYPIFGIFIMFMMDTEVASPWLCTCGAKRR